ncbi:MAG: bifunctional phosphoglucose/phosphomannose isomerase [Candidatus Eisenbacteria bacterium]
MHMPSLEPPYGARDPRAMAALIDALPEHIEQALERTAAQPWRSPIASPALLALGGMGGSAIAGELTAAAFADTAPRPFLVVRDYRWPACVGRDALALLSSNSGRTEETLTLARATVERGAPCVAMTSGGELAELAARHGWPLYRLPGGMPPRAALFHSWVPLTAFVAGLGWAPDPVPAWREAAVLLRRLRDTWGSESPESGNPVKQLARSLGSRTLFVYSGPGPLAAVATRWRQQLNENAKVLAHSAVVPEHNHNEIVGWQVRGPATERIAVLVLRDGEDSAEATARLDLTAEYAARQGAAVHEIRSQGESRLARLASLVQFGDHLSLYLALLGGADPTDIASIDDFKRRLAARASAR